MAQRVAHEDVLSSRSNPGSEPTTEYDSKMVMLRAERYDEITLEETVRHLEESETVPDSCSVAQRTNTYYGPKLELRGGNSEYLLTAPGPDAHLLLWKAKTNPNGFRQGWQKIAEVKASFKDEQPQYDLCPYCGEPLKTLEHERDASVGRCSRADKGLQG